MSLRKLKIAEILIQIIHIKYRLPKLKFIHILILPHTNIFDYCIFTVNSLIAYLIDFQALL